MSNIKLIDLHTHILPTVDDGSNSFELSLEMINQMINDGITEIVLTPHNFKSVTLKERDEQILIFKELLEKTKDLNIKLHLGAEVTYRETFEIDYSKFTINDGKYLLIEFSETRETDIYSIVFNILKKGIIPIIAHIERYQYLTKEDYKKISQLGALIQVNSSAILKKRGRKEYKIAMNLIKENLVNFIASDCHNLSRRTPDLKESYLYLKSKKIDEKQLKNIYYNNQKEVLNN